MRSLSFRVVLAFALFLAPVAVFAANVTINGTTSFAALDGGPDDEDHVVNGIFTVSGDLIVNGTINCNDSGGSSSACPMTFNVGHDLILNAGGALFAENRTGTGTGGAITLWVGHDFIMHAASGTFAAAVVSSNAKNSTASSGGAITASVGNNVTLENGATIDAGAINAAGGRVSITAGQHIDIDGNVFSGPSRTLLSTRLTAQALDGGTSNQSGGEIDIISTSTHEPGITIDSDANIISQGETVGSGPVKVEGCGVIVEGLIASLAKKDSPARVDLRSGKALTIDARDLGVTGATLGRLGHVRVDAPTGAADAHTLDIYAGGQIQVLGPPSTSALYALTGLPGLSDSKSDGATMHILSTKDAAVVSGNAVDDGRSSSGDGGGVVEISAAGNVNMDTARLHVIGDSNTNNTNRNGGTIRVRSYAGNVVWTNGLGDVTPTGSQVPTAQQGSITITACGTINTSGSTFPTNGAPVGPFPATTTGVCSPAAPSLPVTEPALPICNNPPVPNPVSATTLEDHTVTVTMSGSDPDGNSITFTILTPPAHGTLGPIYNATPTSAQVDYTPNADYNGSDSFTFQLDDGHGGTSVGTANITITPVNDAPSFNAGPNETSLEDAGPQFFFPWASGISAGPPDEQATQHVTFTITNDTNPSLFSAGPSVTPSGALSYTSAPDANGSATITVVAHDDGGTANGGVDTSAPQTFTITVTPVNDPPSFTKGPDVSVLEDSGAFSQANWATAISPGPANESSQTVTLSTSNNNNGLFSVQPSIDGSGTLTFATAPNANGSATVTVTAHDNGGTANGGLDTSAPQTFAITVVPVNDPPSFTSGGDVSVLEDSGAYSAVWATNVSAGPPDEAGQTVTFTVTSDNNALFSTQPSVASNGTLTFTPAADANGTATVTVSAHDDGGTANGGVDTSAPQTFTLTVVAVNDPPSFTKGADQTSLEDAGPQTVTGWATNISPGPANESSQTVTFTVTNDASGLFTAQPAVASNGTLTYTAAPNANGTATVTVIAHDDGGTASGGVDTSAPQTFTITIVAVNDAPSFTKGADVSVLEDSGAYSQANWATNISAGPPDESSQIVTFTTTNDNNALFSAQPSVASNGTLTFTPAPNANGTATVTVTAHDDGGTANGGVDTSAPQTFTLAVVSVNDAPSFTKGPDINVVSDAGPETFVNWATNISAGPANESGQTVIFLVSNDNNGVFTSQPAVSSAGTLTFTTAVAAPTTTVHVSVAAHDNGGTANGGVDTSAPQTFNINVTHANQPPVAGPDSFDAVGNTELAVGTSGTQAATLATTGSVLANDSDPEGDPLTVALGSVTAGATVTLNADGSFTYLPPAGFSGDDTFTYNLSDDHGHTVVGTVTIHVTKRVLYVKNDGGGSSGRVDSPFTTLAAAQAAAADNDTLYVFTGDGTTTGQSNGITLAHNGERLIGEGVVLKAVGTYNGATSPQLRPAGTAPQISNAGGVAVTVTKVGTLATAEVSGINITGAGSHGVQITNATDVTMDRDTIASVAGSGIKGAQVVNFSLTNSTISGAAASGVAFDTAVSLTENNLSGAVTIDNNTITTPAAHGVDIQNFDGTISNLDLGGNTITSATTTTASTGSGVRILANGSATTVAKVVKGTITGNTITNFPSGGGILIQGNSAIGGPATQLGTAGSATDVINITGNHISGASATVRMATQAINALVNRSGTGNFVISNNGTAGSPIANTAGVGIATAAFGSSTVTATIANNFLAPHNTAANPGISVGVDQTTAATDSPSLRVAITGNNVSFSDGNGILATARNSAGSLQVEIQNNTVAAPLSGVRPGIRVDSGNTVGNATVCLNISGNTSAGSGGTSGIGLRKQGTSSVVNVFGVDGMAATSSPGVETYVNGLNPAGGGTILLSATSGFTNCSY